MSLIFAALKKLDSAPAATPVRPQSPYRSSTHPWTLPAVALSGALLAGWWLYPSDRDAIATPGDTRAVSTARVHDAAPAAVVTVATTAVATTFPLASATGTGTGNGPTIDRPAPAPAVVDFDASISTRAEVPTADAAIVLRPSTPAPAPAQALSVVVATTPPGSDQALASANAPPGVAVSSAPQPATASASASPSRPPAATMPQARPANAMVVRDASEITATPEDRSVDHLVAAVGSAIQAGDFGVAQAQIVLLAKQLPPRSLTLLRLQAWLAHESDDHVGALMLYRQIVERMPGDQTSAINLAILEARNGQIDSARQRLRHLRARDTDSREIERAISMVEAQLQ